MSRAVTLQTLKNSHSLDATEFTFESLGDCPSSTLFVVLLENLTDFLNSSVVGGQRVV